MLDNLIFLGKLVEESQPCLKKAAKVFSSMRLDTVVLIAATTENTLTFSAQLDKDHPKRWYVLETQYHKDAKGELRQNYYGEFDGKKPIKRASYKGVLWRNGDLGCPFPTNGDDGETDNNYSFCFWSLESFAALNAVCFMPEKGVHNQIK